MLFEKSRLKKIFIIIIIILLLLTFIIVSALIYFKVTYKKKYLNIINSELMQLKTHEKLNDNKLNTNLILSIIKNESGFNKYAKSKSGALGLMQIQYSTAEELAKKSEIENFTINSLYNEEINIKLGILYLNYLFGEFQNKNLVIFAYNAGPYRVKTWLLKNEIDKNYKNSPFKESNAYVSKVLRDEKVYAYFNKEFK